jgi:hypothetical protein
VDRLDIVRRKAQAGFRKERQRMSAERTTKHGRCHDCAQGVVFNDRGFALYIDDDGEESHWYCRYCGSNHVDILDAEGNVIYSEGDLYEFEGEGI